MGKTCGWATLDENDRSWRFYCPACGGTVYWPQPSRGKPARRHARVCPYPMCPWCGEKMGEDDGKENEN